MFVMIKFLKKINNKIIIWNQIYKEKNVFHKNNPSALKMLKKKQLLNLKNKNLINLWKNKFKKKIFKSGIKQN
jgi:hypothetical protein